MDITKKRFFFYGSIFILVFASAAISIAHLKVGDKAPDFTLFEVNGKQASLKQYEGKIVVVHIWSHTCPHCRLMNKTLPATVSPYRKANLAYIMIDIDTDTSGWRKVIKEDQLSFAIHAIDPHDGEAKIVNDYDSPGTPCITIVDEKGNVVAMDVTEMQLKKFLKKRFPKTK